MFSLRTETGGLGEQKLGMIKGVFWTEPDALPVRMHICPKCGKLELTAVEQTDAILLSRKGFKKCVKCGERIPLASHLTAILFHKEKP